MADSNGPVQNNGQIVWWYGVNSINQDSTTTLVRVDAYFRQVSPYYQNYNGTKSWSGHWGSGSGGQAYNLAAGSQVLIVQGYNGYNVTLTDSPQTIYFSVSANHYFGSTGSTLSVSVPARYARTPTNLTATRVTDSQINLAWTRNSNTSSSVIQRSTDGTTWVEHGRTVLNTVSYTDTTALPNQRYYYRVASIGGSGQSHWSAISAATYTTPAPVGAVAAAKSGSDIQISATGLPPYATGYEIWDNDELLNGAVTSFPFNHVSPSASVAHTYTVYAKNGALKSAGTVSNTVQLIAPPLAPSELTPNGGVAASDEPVRLAWRHNPVDTTEQTEYRLQYRAVGATTWTTLTGTTASYRELSLAVGSYEWQVQTRGAHATFGPYSPVATLAVIGRPGVAVQGDGLWDSPIFIAVWTYAQAQSRPQSAWQVELLDSEMQRLEFREGSGATTSLQLSTRMVDGGEYTVRVRAATGSVWSDWSPLAVVAHFEPPEDPLVTGGWQEASGIVAITVEEVTGAVNADVVTVERSVDGGSTWETVIDSIPFDGELAFPDHEALSRGTTIYRVLAANLATGAAAVVTHSVTADSDALWLSGGHALAVHARLPYNPDVEIDRGRSRTVKRYMGRSLGVAYAGGQLSRVVDVSGVLRDSDPDVVGVDALGDLACVDTTTFMYRDPDGRRLYGVISGIAAHRTMRGLWEYGFSFEETTK